MSWFNSCDCGEYECGYCGPVIDRMDREAAERKKNTPPKVAKKFGPLKGFATVKQKERLDIWGIKYNNNLTKQEASDIISKEIKDRTESAYRQARISQIIFGNDDDYIPNFGYVGDYDDDDQWGY